MWSRPARWVAFLGIIGLAFGLIAEPIATAQSGQAPTYTSLRAFNIPNGYVRHGGGWARLDDIYPHSPEWARADATWAVVPGLAGNCVSLESRNFKRHYLRHQNGRLRLDGFQDSRGFREDATFCQVSGLADPNAVSLRSFQFGNAFLRHAGGQVYLADNDNSPLFRADATFRTSSPLISGVFYNSLLDRGADPTMVRHNNVYYLLQGDQYNGNDLVIRKSGSVEGLRDAPPIVLWRHPQCPAIACTEVWAPELQRIRNQWWIFFTGASDNGNGRSHRMFALRGRTDDPSGPYDYLGEQRLPDGQWAIDGVWFEKDGQGYYAWSGWDRDYGNANEVQHLYVARMHDPMTPAGPRVKISSPTQRWETRPNHANVLLNEGPQPIIGPQNQLFMTFSANASWTDDYCIGLLTLNGSPTEPTAWSKSGDCVFHGQDSTIAPGHNGFIQVNGRWWITYHARQYPGTGWMGRSVRLQPLSFNGAGQPIFGTAVSAHQPVPLP
ncbi:MULTISPECIES: AbfB domain-containing protein [unclassified Crossiella]|uniref:AbfB domain-containing protein n=1 Tax=unclassified Crossiella TaxID=2620835 RepID=UPI001FFF2DBA|nr:MULTISPECIES: AbfB domain-containing protein [unclassified Crossiella]MCK2242005.1 family 43 glycosylhydrolase [Crossiella sp. S99.2]MCK2255908.1 family 43 glycosylhydrolase [Crossiella sp. S99.1]